MGSAYDGQQFVGIDLHRRRSVILRQDADGEVLEQVRIDNDPVALACEIEKAGPCPEVVLEATYGWYWAADVLENGEAYSSPSRAAMVAANLPAYDGWLAWRCDRTGQRLDDMRRQLVAQLQTGEAQP